MSGTERYKDQFKPWRPIARGQKFHAITTIDPKTFKRCNMDDVEYSIRYIQDQIFGIMLDAQIDYMLNREAQHGLQRKER